MFLLPKPFEMKLEKGFFNIGVNTEIVLDNKCNFEDFESAKLLQNEIEEVIGMKLNINKAFTNENNTIFLKNCNNNDESYIVNITESGIEICGGSKGLFYGIQTVRQIIRQDGIKLECLRIKDKPYFEYRGFYHDVTRGKVPTLDTLKQLVDRLSFYKINQFQLYVEHTFAFKGLSEVWTGKDPLSAFEILELDEYCRKRNVELVPSLATFGHLFEMLITKSYSDLCELDYEPNRPFSWYERMSHHVLDVSNEKSIQLVETMLDEFIPLFSSDKFNICCDETFDLGTGKSAKLKEQVGAGRLYVDFLKKLITYVKKHDKQVMFWGDIILRHPEFLSEIPKDVVCLNWAYHATVTEDDTKKIAESGIKQYVCPGVGGWNRLINHLDNSFENISKMISFGKKYGAIGVLNTDWGDYGHINPLAGSIPGMIFGAALSWNPEDNRTYDEFDCHISKIEYKDESAKLISKVRELSRCEGNNWWSIVVWHEQEILNSESLKKQLNNFEDIDDKVFADAYEKSIKLESEISQLIRYVDHSRKLDALEIVNSAKGIALMNAACLAIKKYYFNHTKTLIVTNCKELAVEIEYWFDEYSKLWRTRNKESELFRIKDTIVYLCLFLRNVLDK